MYNCRLQRHINYSNTNRKKVESLKAQVPLRPSSPSPLSPPPVQEHDESNVAASSSSSNQQVQPDAHSNEDDVLYMDSSEVNDSDNDSIAHSSEDDVLFMDSSSCSDSSDEPEPESVPNETLPDSQVPRKTPFFPFANKEEALWTSFFIAWESHITRDLKEALFFLLRKIGMETESLTRIEKLTNNFLSLKPELVNFEDDQEDFEHKNFALMNAEEVQDVLKPEELKIKADG